MNLFIKLKQGYGKLLIVGAICALAGFTAGVIASDKKMVVVPFQDAKFVPVNPKQPDGPELAVLWGEPAKGASTMLLKLKKGEGPLHLHTSDYHLVLLQGKMKHWAEDEEAADAKVLEAGSYWYQPGQQAHGDACLTKNV